MTLNEYRNKFFPDKTKRQCRQYYNMYKEVEKVSTDMKFNYMLPAIASTGMSTTEYIEKYHPFAPYDEPQACNPVPCQKPIGNNPMYVDNDKHIESSKINYLIERAGSAFYEANQKITEAFHLENDPAPMTAAELVKRVQDGKFLLNDDTKNKSQYEPARYIQWRDPALPADQVGAKAAREVLEKLFQDTKDTIAIGTPAEGLAAVKTLDAWTPTVGTA